MASSLQHIQLGKNFENIAFLYSCLRIARESIFTGLNNFKARAISDVKCADYFGFTDKEVREMLNYYEMEPHWENSSSNEIIQDMIEDSTESVKAGRRNIFLKN